MPAGAAKHRQALEPQRQLRAAEPHRLTGIGLFVDGRERTIGFHVMDTENTSVRSTIIDGIPGYRIDRLLDQGGMGGVYLAEDQTLKRLVAIKVINAELTENTEFKKRFTTEALIIAGFQHPNIVTVFASDWLGQKQYFVMEYVRGGTLKQRLDSGKLAAPLVFAIASQMADSLAYSHERGVIHRDFKPNNVLLRENGTPVLSDFGIAKSVVTDGAETAIGMVVGSAFYMAPAQALGSRISNRVDIYSFGLVLYQMLMGQLPPRHPLRGKVDDRQLIRSLRTVEPAVAQLIVRCLQASPEQRPTAIQCHETLAVLARRPSPRRRARSSRLALVARQGWGMVANPYSRRDHCMQ
jgi:serine/threonine protein kinase